MSSKHAKFLPFIISFFTFLFLETFFFYPKSIYITLILINLLFLTLLKKFFNLDHKERLNYLTLPALFTLGIVTYSTMIPNKIIIQLLFSINIIFIYTYFRELYLFFDTKVENKFSNIENIFYFGNFLSFFFISASLYGFYSHINISIILLLAIMLIVCILLVYNIIFMLNLKTGKENKNNLSYIIIFCVILIELASAIWFLPFDHNMIGLVLSICYYMLIGLAKYYLLLGKIEIEKIKLYLGFGFSAIFFILATAQWL